MTREDHARAARRTTNPAAAASPARPTVLWRTGESEVEGTLLMEDLGEHHWTVRMRDGWEWRWTRFDGSLSVPAVQAHLSGLPCTQVRVWVPAPELGTLLVVDDTAAKRSVLAAWHPFPDPGLAELHPSCWRADQGALEGRALKAALALLGSKVPAGWTPRDAAYFLAGSTPHHARAALALSRQRSLPVELAGRSLADAGFARLSAEAAEIAAGLAENWSQTAAELVSAAELLA